jgi:alpha-glucuronidase
MGDRSACLRNRGLVLAAALRLTFAVALICCPPAGQGIASAAAAVAAPGAMPDDFDETWLRYAPIHDPAVLREYQSLPPAIVRLDDAPTVRSAQLEIARGIRCMLGRVLRIETQAAALGDGPAIVVGTEAEIEHAFAALHVALWHAPGPVGAEGFTLARIHARGGGYWLVAGHDDAGVLYGAFRLLQTIARGEVPGAIEGEFTPAAPVRWVNQWDNLDGSIERGYAGRSIFFDDGSVRADLTRAADYARLLASLGINGCTINNVNADPRLLTPPMIAQVARVANAFRPWGVRLSLAVNLSSPQTIGGLDTFDPLDPGVVRWWRGVTDAIYREIPDFGGFVVKADSEGRPGPSSYGRTPADAANTLAAALRPHGGLLLYRTFVYNHHLDWRDPKADRARAAYDIFHPLDGDFLGNVILQVKNGPIDFQVREPASPLFGGLRRTRAAIELQVTQEYTGQQRHLVFLAPMWKQALDLKLIQPADLAGQPGEGKALEEPAGGAPAAPAAKGTNPARAPLAVKDVISGRAFHRSGGFVAVVNVGLDDNWLGHPLGLANLYAFGRLAWDPDLSSAQIAREWTELSFGNDALVDRTITAMLLSSWRIYEQYTGPLGLGTLTDILHSHYGPGIESAERNGWGQWIRADREGVGMDRTIATGTGFIGQYPPALARRYESLATCPDHLLLFFHHVPYTYRIHGSEAAHLAEGREQAEAAPALGGEARGSRNRNGERAGGGERAMGGETVIQYIYDSHYAGAAAALGLVTQWQLLHGRVDDRRFARVLALLQYQSGHAIVWRDAVCNWFFRMSGIADLAGRVGRHPDRIEAEAMQLTGYKVVGVTPWETASGGKAIVCEQAGGCTAATRLSRPAGWYDIAVQYFDYHHGASRYSVGINGRPIGAWTAAMSLPADRPNGDTSTRVVIRGVALRPGDMLTIEGRPDGPEPAPLDYLAIHPSAPLGRAAAAAGVPVKP